MSGGVLFEGAKAGSITLANRILMAPLTRCRAGEGNVPTDLMAKYYEQRASAGLIVSEATQVMLEGQGYVSTPGIHSDAQVEGWRKVTDAVHKAGGKIVLQLWHVGRCSHSAYQPGNVLPVAPSAVKLSGNLYVPNQGMIPYETPRALEVDELPRIVKAYADGASNAIRAGFDGVEIHSANGYLIDQFLQDCTNKRTDEYGGSIENRLRFPLQVANAVVAAVGADRTGIRISPSSTFHEMGDSDPHALFGAYVKELAKLNLAYLHVIAANEKDQKHATEGHKFVPSSFFRPLFSGFLIANSEYTSKSATEAVETKAADGIAFGKLFLSNPDLPKRFLQGSALNEANPATFYGGTEVGYTDYPFLS